MSPSSLSYALDRRSFLAMASACLGTAAVSASAREKPFTGKAMTVRGPINPDKMGLTLPHEHVLVDFIGADKVSRDRYSADEVFEVMLPLLKEARERGVKTFVDCTPMFLGRDPLLLRRLSVASELNIVTNAGLYKEPYLPKYAFEETAERLAERWIREFHDGIEGTGIRPGFIKIAVNPGPLLEIQKKIVRAAAIASLETGLTIGCHAGHGEAALEAIRLLREMKTPLRKFIVYHADGIDDPADRDRIAESGGWVSLDGIGWRPAKDHVEMISHLLKGGYEDRILLSHDAGWYDVGKPKGGDPKRFTVLTDALIPALRSSGIEDEAIRRMTVANPKKAYVIG